MKKLCLIIVLFILSFSTYAKIKRFSSPIKEENIYIVDDKLNIMKSKKYSQVYI